MNDSRKNFHTWLSVTESVFDRLSESKGSELLSSIDPDIIVINNPKEFTEKDYRNISDEKRLVVDDSGTIVGRDYYDPVGINFATKSTNPNEGEFIFDPDVEIRLNETSLTSEIIGLDELTGETIISPMIEMGNVIRHNGNIIYGCGVIQAGNVVQFVQMETFIDNAIATFKSINPFVYGLRKVAGVGYNTEKSLQDAGYHTLDDIYKTEIDMFKESCDVRDWRLTRIHRSATSFKEQTVKKRGEIDLSLPSNPLFVSIATTYPENRGIWMITVRDVQNGNIQTFVSKDGNSTILYQFINWLITNRDDRALLFSNGRVDVISVLTDTIREELPEYSSLWKTINKINIIDYIDDRNDLLVPSAQLTTQNIATGLGYQFRVDGDIDRPQFSYVQLENCSIKQLKLYNIDKTSAIQHIYRKLYELQERIENTNE